MNEGAAAFLAWCEAVNETLESSHLALASGQARKLRTALARMKASMPSERADAEEAGLGEGMGEAPAPAVTAADAARTAKKPQAASDQA